MSVAAKKAASGPTPAFLIPGQLPGQQQPGQHSRTTSGAFSPKIVHSRPGSQQLAPSAVAQVAAGGISLAAQTAVAAAAGSDSSRPQLPPRPGHLRAASQQQQQPQRPASPRPQSPAFHAEEHGEDHDPFVQHTRGGSVDIVVDVSTPGGAGHARVGSRAVQLFQSPDAAKPILDRAGQLGDRVEGELENADENSIGCWGTVVKYWNYMITSIHEFVMSNPLIALVSAVVFAVFGISQLLPTIVAAILTGIPLICFSTLIFINIIQHNQDFSNSLALQIEGKHVAIDKVKKAIEDSPLRNNPRLQKEGSLRSLGVLNFDGEEDATEASDGAAAAGSAGDHKELYDADEHAGASDASGEF